MAPLLPPLAIPRGSYFYTFGSTVVSRVFAFIYGRPGSRSLKPLPSGCPEPKVPIKAKRRLGDVGNPSPAVDSQFTWTGAGSSWLPVAGDFGFG
jgi:hypothetical protein